VSAALVASIMQQIIEYCRSDGLREIVGQVMHENTTMLLMCRELGFRVVTDPEEHGICNVTLCL
jgi:acetyltransferase